MSREILFGFEQEMTLCSLPGPRAAMGFQFPEGLVQRFIALVARRHPHLRGSGERGIFLPGFRLYEDCGKCEIAGPECSHPNEIVCYTAASERILAPLIETLAADDASVDTGIYRCNVSYGPNSSSWGYHESFLLRNPPGQLAPDIVPFLASRVLFSGAGGWASTQPGGCSFTLSPRASSHIGCAVSSSSVSPGRAMVHLRDDPLSRRGFHRLQVICGETLCSHQATWLRAATTALVVAMADGGLHPGRDVQLANPVEAIRTFARDPTCTAQAATVSGKQITALEIQRHYLDLARKAIRKTSFMPPWTEQAIEPWESILDRLQNGAPDNLGTCLDWPIKYHLYSRHIRSAGFSWPLLAKWSVVGSFLNRLAQSSSDKKPRARLTANIILNPGTTVHAVLEHLRPHLHQREMSCDQLPAYLKLRDELLALDWNFARLGPSGIFNRLDQQGVLDHRVPWIREQDIQKAVTDPPARGRARIRGDAIKMLHAQGRRESANWQAVFDAPNRRWLDLSDPFCSRGVWSKLPNRTLDEEATFDFCRV